MLVCVCIIIINCFCIPLFSALKQAHCTHVASDSEDRMSDYPFYSVLLIFTEVVYWQCCLHGWPCETAVILVQVLCTPYNHAPIYSVTSFKATWVCVFSCNIPVTTCTFGRVTRIFYSYIFYCTAITQGCNGYQNKSQHKKLTLGPFDYEFGALTTELFLPHVCMYIYIYNRQDFSLYKCFNYCYLLLNSFWTAWTSCNARLLWRWEVESVINRLQARSRAAWDGLA